MTFEATLIVLAKAPVPGRVKTRLCPPCSPAQAADLAAAALADTLDAVAAVPARGHVLAVEGAVHFPVPDPFTTIPQRGDGLDERLAAAFEDAAAAYPGPALLVGMDTPQLTPAVLSGALAQLLSPGVDAVLGPANDGGWWAIGLRHADPRVFLGVPTSLSTTGGRQLRRLMELELRTVLLPSLEDVDDIGSARSVADIAPHTRFASRLNLLPT